VATTGIGAVGIVCAAGELVNAGLDAVGVEAKLSKLSICRAGAAGTDDGVETKTGRGEAGR
jgi:hypothetical protein